MCGLAIAAAALGVASAAQTVIGAIQENKQAKAEERAANEAAASDFAAIQDQRNELNRVAGQQSIEAQRETLRRRAAARVAQGEAGIGGLTPIRELAAIEQAGSLELSTIESNRVSQLAQTERSIASIAATRAERASRARSRRRGVFSTGLQAAASGASGAVTGFHIGQQFERLSIK